ncbi:MAG TPA: diacylglycerol kinase [Gemmataceae bacterium]|nr:diacylglycerol kinase [Gemmataceae bacterium]
MAADWWDAERTETVAARPKTPRRWRDKFREAFRGVKLGVRGHSSFFVHFFFAALAVTAALALGCNYLEWCLVLGCIGAVITAELFNSAIETLFHGLDVESKARTQGCLDIAAGAVLVAGLTAVLIGTTIFGYRLLVLLRWLPTE